MPRIDVHQHLWPRAFSEALLQRTAVPYLEADTLHLGEGAYQIDLGDHELETRLALLDRWEIDLAVVSLQQTLGLGSIDPGERELLEGIWEDGILEVAAAADGRIVPLAAGRPRAGFAGVALGADRFDDLESLAPTLEGLRGSGFLFVHPTAGSWPAWAPAWWPAVVDYTSQMQRAYFAWLARGQELWPDVAIVFAVLAGGGPFQLERLGSRGIDVRSILHANVYFDTASYGRRAVELCAETFGVEQLVFGSDLPVVEPDVTMRAIKGFGESVEKLITSDNPTKLLR